MRWKVQLEGKEVGLEQLSESFDESPRIFEDDGEYYIWSAQFEQLDESGEVKRVAENIITTVRHLAEIDSLPIKELAVSCVVEIQEDGSERRIQHVSATMTATSVVSARVSVNGEELPPRAESTYEYTRLALNDPEVEELIELRDRGSHWVNLYRIYEYIQDNIESEETIVTQGWWTDKQKNRFTCTANDPEAIGHEARHAGGGVASVEDMSDDQMSHGEAESLINGLIKDWLEYRMEISELST